MATLSEEQFRLIACGAGFAGEDSHEVYLDHHINLVSAGLSDDPVELAFAINKYVAEQEGVAANISRHAPGIRYRAFEHLDEVRKIASNLS
jgi:hypothetical protein